MRYKRGNIFDLRLADLAIETYIRHDLLEVMTPETGSYEPIAVSPISPALSDYKYERQAEA